MRLALIIMLLALGLVPAHGQGAQARKYFGDWLVACLPDGYCSAVSYINPNPGDGRVADYWFRIGRHAEETYWELSFTPIVIEADWNQPLNFSVDGVAETFAGHDQIAPYGAVNDLFLLGKKAQVVMDRLMPGAALTASFTGRDGESRSAEFSLKGLTAALIWIDERQNRLGSERVAEAPPVGLQPAWQPPVLAGEVTIDQIPADLIALDAARPDECDGFEFTDDPFYRYDLGGEKTLYLLPCTSGAYNRFYSVYVGRGTWFDLQLFAEPRGAAGWQAAKGIWLDAFDPETKVLSSYNLGNSMGACGTRGRWVWSGESFYIVDYHAGGNCPDGPNEPGDFPLVYENTELPADLRPPAQ